MFLYSPIGCMALENKELNWIEYLNHQLILSNIVTFLTILLIEKE